MIDEGCIKFESYWRPGPPVEDPESEALLQARPQLYNAGLIGYDNASRVGYGNLSIRCGQSSNFLITGTQTGHLSSPGPEHLAKVTRSALRANRVWSVGATEASSESLTHAAIYRLDISIRSVAHGHDLAAWRKIAGAAPTTSDRVAYGTPEMALEIGRLFRESAFRQTGAAVMGGHEGGLIAFGADPEQACRRLLALAGRQPPNQG